jgi:hypothetical protein
VKILNEQNSDTWSKYRRLLFRLGASRASLILGLNEQYGNRIAFAQYVQFLRHKDGPQEKKEITEYGHFYEPFVSRALKYALSNTIEIKEGGFWVAARNNKDRLRYGVSPDGVVYAGGTPEALFEAKCSWAQPHTMKAAKERYPDVAVYRQWTNPNWNDGIPAGYMAQMQMQMGVIGAKACYFSTVKWNRGYPPHPELGIPPFSSMHTCLVPFSNNYWYKYEKPQLDAFTSALYGWEGGKFPDTIHAAAHEGPPRVHGVLTANRNMPHVQSKIDEMDRILGVWERTNRERALAFLEQKRREDSCLYENNQRPKFDKWWFD